MKVYEVECTIWGPKAEITGDTRKAIKPVYVENETDATLRIKATSPDIAADMVVGHIMNLDEDQTIFVTDPETGHTRYYVVIDDQAIRTEGW